jgi:phage terminase small subunit
VTEESGAYAGLTDKHRVFVNEYTVDFHGANAAIRAGYSETRARQTASELLARDDIAAAIAERQAERREKAENKAAKVIAELEKLGFANMLDYMRVGAGGDPVLHFDELTRDQAAALAEVTVEDFLDGRGEDAREVRRVKFKLVPKLGALELLARHYGLLKDIHEHTGKDGGPIQTESLTDLEAARRIAFALELGKRALAAERDKDAPVKEAPRKTS